MEQQAKQSAHTQIGLEVIGNLVRTNLQHGGFLVAEFRGSDGHPHSEEAKANAHLFAAAHDLLEALIQYAEVYSEHWKPGMPILEPMSDAAISKAQGSAS